MTSTKLLRWIVTFGGSGLLPGMPGTWGSTLAAVLLWLIYLLLGHTGLLASQPVIWPLILFVGLLALSALCVSLGSWGVSHFARDDPGPFVLDEAAAICLTMLWLPTRPGWREAWPLAMGFVAFRIFDIWKPPPARQLERLPGGWGILLDDLAAGIYANLLCQLALRLLLPNWP